MSEITTKNTSINFGKIVYFFGITIMVSPIIMTYIESGQNADNWGWALFMTIPLGGTICIAGIIMTAWISKRKLNPYIYSGILVSLFSILFLPLFLAGLVLICIGVWRM